MILCLNFYLSQERKNRQSCFQFSLAQGVTAQFTRKQCGSNLDSVESFHYANDDTWESVFSVSKIANECKCLLDRIDLDFRIVLSILTSQNGIPYQWRQKVLIFPFDSTLVPLKTMDILFSIFLDCIFDHVKDIDCYVLVCELVNFSSSQNTVVGFGIKPLLHVHRFFYVLWPQNVNKAETELTTTGKKLLSVNRLYLSHRAISIAGDQLTFRRNA